jgi:adenosine deaminase
MNLAMQDVSVQQRIIIIIIISWGLPTRSQRPPNKVYCADSCSHSSELSTAPSQSSKQASSSVPFTMCKTALHNFLAALPKCEHHIHIEGSLEPELLFSLAESNRVALPSAEVDPAYQSPDSLRARYKAFKNLDDFLSYYYTGMSVLLTSSDFDQLAYAYFSKASSQNVRHAEVFFDPQAHTTRGVDFSSVVEGLVVAKRRAQKDFGMSVEIIPCFLRHLPLSSALETFEVARGKGWFGDGTFVGMGMDSSEVPFPPQVWTELYKIAKEAGVERLTAHAGEEGPASYVSSSLDLLGVQRIDHGINALKDEELVRRLAREEVLLTTCPLSNFRLRCISEIGEFPLRKMLDAGARFSVNSDDPAYFGGYILENYCALQEEFGLTVRDWERIVKGAVMGSWCGEERKAEMLMETEDVVGHWAQVLDEQ